MIGRILVPLDGSAPAAAVIPVAGAIARKTAGEVRLVHVVDLSMALAHPDYQVEARAWGARYLADTANQSSLSGVPVSTEVREGVVLDELRHEAAQWPADLVAMATHGRGGLSRLWMGSVADRFVRSSIHPILLLGPEAVPEQPGAFAPRRVVVPLDGSALAEDAVAYASAFAKAFDARILLVRGLVQFGAFEVAHLSFNPKLMEADRAEAEAYLTERAAAVRGAGIDSETMVLPEPGLAEAISDRTAGELIVMTTNGRGGLDRAVFGSLADKVVRSATCPVLVIPPSKRRSS